MGLPLAEIARKLDVKTVRVGGGRAVIMRCWVRDQRLILGHRSESSSTILSSSHRGFEDAIGVIGIHMHDIKLAITIGVIELGQYPLFGVLLAVPVAI